MSSASHPTNASSTPGSSALPLSATPSTTRSISIALPPPDSSSKPPESPEPPATDDRSFTSNIPSGPSSSPPSIPRNDPMSSSPPFHTHAFFLVLERTFPTPVARTLMRATRGLLNDRIGGVRREALTIKDLDNQAYLFRAALSELRAECTMSTRNETAKLESDMGAVRREVDALDGKMKEDIQTLKHEIQMEVDNRKNEARADLKSQDIMVEELLNKSTINLGDLRTEIEKIKWDNTRQAVLYLGMFALFIVIGMEISGLFSKPKRSSPPPPSPPPPPPPDIPYYGYSKDFSSSGGIQH
ncbi:hypothetical protein M422DRAFT_238177 [Sphaerobolus stellatus SS14]|nr:hypothetical protein M422DRAFT_238177 [Sphaerobolus stellatus SS14]